MSNNNLYYTTGYSTVVSLWQRVSLNEKEMKGETGMFNGTSLNLFLGRHELYEFSTNTHPAFRWAKHSGFERTTI